jgi:uncharacterized protein YoaH (UPF0181 family)
LEKLVVLVVGVEEVLTHQPQQEVVELQIKVLMVVMDK